MLIPASNIYSFNMLAYHMVEEEIPWCGERGGFIRRKVTSGALPPFESEEWTAALQAFVKV